MKITITGSLGNISRRLTEQLIRKGHDITLISHNPERKTAIEGLHATAAIGSVEDYEFLVSALKDAEAVYTMVPPNFNTTNYKELVKSTGNAFAKAIDKTGIRYVVNLSSIGAHFPEGNGPSGVFLYEENELNQLPETHVLHLRAGMFYTNFYGSIPMIKHLNTIGNNFDATLTIAMSHPSDIADAAADALNSLNFQGKRVQYVVSDEKKGSEIAQALGNAVGKPDLRWATLSDEELLNGMMQNGFSHHMAGHFVELGSSIREGRLFAHYQQNKPPVFTNRKLEDFADEFASIYHKL